MQENQQTIEAGSRNRSRACQREAWNLSFNADNRFGKQIDPLHLTRGYVIGKDYIALYRVVKNELRVGHLFATKSDYVKLLK